jgi:hypothetical protein
MAAHWIGGDRRGLTTQQKLRIVERALQRLIEAQGKTNSPYAIRLKREAARLRGVEKAQPKVRERMLEGFGARWQVTA